MIGGVILNLQVIYYTQEDSLSENISGKRTKLKAQ